MNLEPRIVLAYSIIAVLLLAVGIGLFTWRRRRRLFRLRQAGNKQHDPMYVKLKAQQTDE